MRFPYWGTFEGFDPLKVNFNTSDTPKAHTYTKPRLLSRHIHCELWSVGELTEQEAESEEKAMSIF